jgi:hypothetical protein
MSTSSGLTLARLVAKSTVHSHAAARIRAYEPEFATVATAIRSFFRTEYAAYLSNDEEIPMRTSTYSGKGVGFYATSEDGRPDWTVAMKRFIFGRTDSHKGFEFTLETFARAMKDLEQSHPRWHAATIAFDVESLPILTVAKALNVHTATVHRYRNNVIHFLYPYILHGDASQRRPIFAKYLPRIKNTPEGSYLKRESAFA